MNDTRTLNRITYIVNLLITELQLTAFKPHVDAYLSNPENHPYLMKVYGKIEKVVKEP